MPVKYKTLSLLTLLSIGQIASASWQDSPLIINGQVNTQNPLISINANDTSTILLEEFSGTLSHSDSLCKIIYNESEATSSSTYCFIEPVTLPSGISLLNGLMSGIIQDNTIDTIRLNVYAIQGNGGTKELIDTIEKKITLLTPEKPNIIQVQYLADTSVSLNNLFLTKKPSSLTAKIDVKELTYNQKISSEIGNCLIDNGNSNCQINAISQLGSISGSRQLNYLSKSFNDNLSSLTINSMFEWDFNGPIISGYSYKSKDYIINNNLSELKENNLIFGYSKSPTKINLETANISAELSKIVFNTVYGEKSIVATEHNASALSFDLTGVPDGKYKPIAYISDIDGNESTLQTEEIVIDNNPPTVEAWQGNKIITTESIDSYSVKNLSFKITDELSTPIITEIKIDGANAAFTNNNGIYTINDELQDVSNKINSIITVYGKDPSGNTVTKELTLNFTKGTFSDLTKTNFLKNIENVSQVVIPKGFPCSTYGMIDGPKTEDCLFAVESIDGLVFKDVNAQLTIKGNFKEQKPIKISLHKNINGNLVKFAEKTYDVTITDPLPPVVLFNPLIKKSNNDYLYTPVTKSLGTSVVSINGDVTIQVTGDSVMNFSEDLLVAKGNKISHQIIPNKSATMWESKENKIKVFYTKMPEVFSEVTFNAMNTLSPDSITLAAQIEGSVVLNTKPVIIQTFIGNNLGKKETTSTVDGFGNNWKFDPVVNGNWSVYLAKKVAGQFVAITDKVAVNDAMVEFSISTENQSNLTIYPIAEMDANGTKQTKYAPALSFYVMQGNDVSTQVSGARYKTNNINIGMANLMLIYASSMDKKSASNITWEVKKPGGEWTIAPELKNANYVYYKMDQVGDYLFKAKTTNKFTGVVSESNEFALPNYLLPEIAIEAKTYNLIGEKNYASTSIINDFTDDEVDFQYSIDNGTNWLDGKNFEFESDTKKVLKLLARAKLKTTPSEYEKGWTTAKKEIIFVEPKQNIVKITMDESIVVVGEKLGINIDLRPWYFDIDPARLKGTITFENGEERQLVYGKNKIVLENVTKDMIKNNRLYFTLSSLLDPYEQTRTKFTYSAKAIEYVWPEFNVYTKQTQKTAPSKAVVTIVPADQNLSYFKDVKYEWVIPEGLAEDKSNTDKYKGFTIQNPGKYDIAITVSDSKGNKTEKAVTLEAFEVENYEMTVSSTYKTPIMNEPANASFKITSVKGGGPTDSIDSYVWSLDGTPLTTSSFSVSVNNLKAGSHTMEVTLKSKQGKEVKNTINFDVLQNLLPECEITTAEVGKNFNFVANCTDKDGKVVAYKWVDENNAVYSRKSNLSFYNGKNTIIKNIKLTVTDDSLFSNDYEIGDLYIQNGIFTLQREK
jgi:hypothetical protein